MRRDRPRRPLATNRVLLGRIDAWAGGVACLALTALRKGLAPLARDREAGRRGVLLIKLAEQGSTVLAREAIRDAILRHGAEHTYFLVFEENRFILDALGLVPPENVFAVRTTGLPALIASLLGQLRRIRRRGLLACVDLEFFARSTAVLAFLTGIPRRVGLHGWHSEGPYRGDLFTHRLRYNPHLHTGTLFRGMIAAVDADPAALPRFDWVAPGEPTAPPAFVPTAEEAANVRRLLGEALGDRPPGPLILLNANASDLLPLRRWSDDKYVALARRILAEVPGARVAFTGGPSERAKIEAIAASVGDPRAVSVAGKTTLRELLALYGEADVLVTNDSGPAHFAALTPIDTVVLFGPETPRLFGTLSPRSQSLTAGLSCSPCVSALNNRQTACRDNLCMQKIEVAHAFDAVGRALERRRGDLTNPRNA